MHCSVTDEALTSRKEQLGVFMGQMGQHIKHVAINWHERRRGETGTAEEADPMYCVVIRNGILDDPFLNQTPSFILFTQSHL
jgi:hypothetical protein